MVREQRRCHLRASIIDTVSMNDSEGEITFDVKNISEGGAFLYSSILFEVGDKLNLSFKLPGSENIITTDAEIIRCEKNEQNGRAPGMAVRFTSLTPADSQAINDYIVKYFSSVL